MERRQTRAVNQLITDAEEEKQKLQEQKQEEYDTTKAAKRKRTEDIDITYNHKDDTYCPLCTKPFNENVLEKHIQRCQRMKHKEKSLQQTTLASYAYD
jgi:phenylalanyl-tRNA synthetase alpha subunit